MRPVNAEKVEKGCVSANRKEGFPAPLHRNPEQLIGTFVCSSRPFDEMGAKI